MLVSAILMAVLGQAEVPGRLTAHAGESRMPRGARSGTLPGCARPFAINADSVLRPSRFSRLFLILRSRATLNRPKRGAVAVLPGDGKHTPDNCPHRHRGYDLRDITRPGALSRDPGPRKGLSMRGETIRRDLRERRPGTRRCHLSGPPPETSTHATPCRKGAYARRKTRTPQP